MTATATLGTDLAQATDPVSLCAGIGMEPDEWQVRALRSTARRQLWRVHRQGGKSVTASIAAVHAAVYSPGSLVLFISPSQRQSSEIFLKAKAVLRSIPVRPAAESALSLTLASGSRIVSLPGQEATVRGYSSVALAIFDEAARVPDELFHAVSPMVAVSKGRIIALSTPWGRRGWFWEQYEHGHGWKRYTVRASECPRISPEFLEAERQSIGAWSYSQEIRCFVRLVVVQRLQRRRYPARLIRPYRQAPVQLTERKPAMPSYAIGLDLAAAKDYSALCVLQKVRREVEPPRHGLRRHTEPARFPSGDPIPGSWVTRERMGRCVVEWHLVHAQRWDLGTPVPRGCP